jgi:quercetin dioxygenase-like cupin family protein
MTYRPLRPAFDGPTFIPKEGRALQIWGDDETGEVADAIYVSNEKIHLMVFTMPPGGGFRHSSDFRTFFDADELYYVLSGALVMNNPQRGEVHLVRAGEAVYFGRDTWHHAFTHGDQAVRVLEFIGPGPLSGNTQAYARTHPNLDAVKTVADEWLGRWPHAREEARREETMRVVGERDVLWRLEGAEGVLVGIRVSTDRMTVGSVHLRPGQRSDVHAHGGDECVVGVSGRFGVRLPEHEGQTWYELESEDGMFIPEGTPHRYQNFSGDPATLFFVVGPSYLDTSETQT